MNYSKYKKAELIKMLEERDELDWKYNNSKMSVLAENIYSIEEDFEPIIKYLKNNNRIKIGSKFYTYEDLDNWMYIVSFARQRKHIKFASETKKDEKKKKISKLSLNLYKKEIIETAEKNNFPRDSFRELFNLFNTNGTTISKKQLDDFIKNDKAQEDINEVEERFKKMIEMSKL